MKRPSLAPVLAAATLFLAPALRAEPPADSPTKSNPASDAEMARKQRDADILKRYDKNGDGKLDDDEIAAAKMENLKQGETKGVTTGRGRFVQQFLKRFDKNGDGRLDDTEWEQAFTALEKNARFMQQFDRDGDGKLSPDEKTAAKTALRKRAAALTRSTTQQ